MVLLCKRDYEKLANFYQCFGNDTRHSYNGRLICDLLNGANDLE